MSSTATLAIFHKAPARTLNNRLFAIIISSDDERKFMQSKKSRNWVKNVLRVLCDRNAMEFRSFDSPCLRRVKRSAWRCCHRFPSVPSSGNLLPDWDKCADSLFSYWLELFCVLFSLLLAFSGMFKADEFFFVFLPKKKLFLHGNVFASTLTTGLHARISILIRSFQAESSSLATPRRVPRHVDTLNLYSNRRLRLRVQVV